MPMKRPDVMNVFAHYSPARGFTLLEVLISLLVIALGLLGLAGLQARLQQAEFESYQRSQAIVLLYDMVDRIRANKATASCFAITTNTTNGTPYLGTGATASTGCAASTAAYNTMADAGLAEWDGLLDGAAEKSSGNSVGAMIGARGCVSYGGSATEIVSGGVTVAGTFTDNSGQNFNARRNEFTGEFLPYIRVNADTPRVNGNLFYQPAYRFNANNSRNNGFSQYANGHFRAIVVEGHFHIRVMCSDKNRNLLRAAMANSVRYEFFNNIRH